MCAATPDFAAVYRYLGSVFDPGTMVQADKLREMDAINREAVSAFLSFVPLSFFFCFFPFFLFLFFFFLGLYLW